MGEKKLGGQNELNCDDRDDREEEINLRDTKMYK